MVAPGSDQAGFDDVRRFAEHLTEQQLFCREEGHRCDIPHSAKYDPQYRVWVEAKKCACGVLRVKEISVTTGLIVSRRLDYSETDGYLMTGLGRMSAEGNGAIRIERRMREYGEKAMAAADRRLAKRVEKEQAELTGSDRG